MKSITCKILFSFLFITASQHLRADTTYVRKLVDTLCSPAFFGRGYLNNGMQNAADFIAGNMKQSGLDVKRQNFDYPVTYFPGKMAFAINGKALVAGEDFLVDASSGPCNCTGKMERADSNTFVDKVNRVLLQKVPKLTWDVATQQADYAALQVVGLPEQSFSYECQLESRFNNHFKASNIIGTVLGTLQPDSFIVYTAHYDHLGGMGNTVYFPGANDNAGGVAMMLDLAKFYAGNRPPYSVMFIAFAGEEAGLIGSKYYTEHPLVTLGKISFLVNLDLVGTGDEGITVVNATEYPAAFKLLQDINSSKQLLVAVNSRGKAANSDHYWFTEKGVRSFFIYTLGKRKDYHDVHDVAATLPLYEIHDLEILLKSFADSMMQH